MGLKQVPALDYNAVSDPKPKVRVAGPDDMLLCLVSSFRNILYSTNPRQNQIFLGISTPSYLLKLNHHVLLNISIIRSLYMTIIANLKNPQQH